jgi:hypothetical protein
LLVWDRWDSFKTLSESSIFVEEKLKRARWDALKLLSESLLNKQTATRKEPFSVLSKVSRTGLTPAASPPRLKPERGQVLNLNAVT